MNAVLRVRGQITCEQKTVDYDSPCEKALKPIDQIRSLGLFSEPAGAIFRATSTNKPISKLQLFVACRYQNVAGATMLPALNGRTELFQFPASGIRVTAEDRVCAARQGSPTKRLIECGLALWIDTYRLKETVPNIRGVSQP